MIIFQVSYYQKCSNRVIKWMMFLSLQTYAGVVHKEEVNVVCTNDSGDEPRVVIAKMASSSTAGVTIMHGICIVIIYD